MVPSSTDRPSTGWQFLSYLTNRNFAAHSPSPGWLGHCPPIGSVLNPQMTATLSLVLDWNYAAACFFECLGTVDRSKGVLFALQRPPYLLPQGPGEARLSSRCRKRLFDPVLEHASPPTLPSITMFSVALTRKPLGSVEYATWTTKLYLTKIDTCLNSIPWDN